MTSIFQDFETQSLADLTVTGGLKYVLDASTRALLWSWGLDDDPIKLWCPDLSAELVPEVWAYVKGRMATIGNCPPEVVEALKRPDTYIVGWNQNFDRQVWQQVVTPDHDWPRIEIEQTLDAMCQALASNLPGGLDFAGRALGLGTKTVGGKAIMKRFADRAQPLPGSPADIEALMAKGHSRAKAIEIAIESWMLYLDYSVQDTELTREVWKCTRPLDGSEWQEYWDNEHINDRGMPVDLEIAAAAVRYREEEERYTIERITEITNGEITSPTLTKRINEWLYDRLSDDLAETMIKQRDDEGYVTRLTGSKVVLTQLLEDIHASDTPPEDDVIELLELLQYGRSSSAVKFEKMLHQEVDGRIFGQYVFNGAGQTGRGSSRGIQVHALVRDAMPNELDVLDMVVARAPIEAIRHLPISKKPLDVERAKEGRTAVSTVLSRLIRPTFVAPEGKTFVWGDWSAIEARVMPWLANSRAAEETILTPYRNGDDIYILNAAAIFGEDVDTIRAGVAEHDPVYAGMRQAGKISGLSLQFGGSVGAYRAMARGYGVRVTNEEAQLIVDGWRSRNRWAKVFWNQCDDAARRAMHQPGTLFPAGRLNFIFYPGLLGGSLVTFLPCGRPLVYPMARYEKIERFGEMQTVLTYLNGMGRSMTYGGKLGQNGTQAAAASILRSTIRRVSAEEPDGEIIGHTHDELLCEVDTTRSSGFAERLEAAMISGFGWTEGLPLAAEITTDWYYHK
jgi:DNA polymerase bacteriophage-type